MAISVVQTFAFDDATSTSSHTQSSISTTAGNLLIVAVFDRANSEGFSVTSVTDSASNTWTRAAHAESGSAACTSIWYTSNATAITSYTINLGTSGRILSQFYEASGASGLDVTQAGTGVSTSVSSGATSTPAGSKDLAIGIGGNDGAGTHSSRTFTSGAGTEVDHSSVNSRACTGYLILSSATAQTYSATASTTVSWAAAVALWQEAPPKPGGTMGLMGVG